MNDPRQIAHKAKKESSPAKKKENIEKDTTPNEKIYIEGVDTQNKATPSTDDFMKRHFPNAYLEKQAKSRQVNEIYDKKGNHYE
jgi:hypothetical protein